MGTLMMQEGDSTDYWIRVLQVVALAISCGGVALSVTHGPGSYGGEIIGVGVAMAMILEWIRTS